VNTDSTPDSASESEGPDAVRSRRALITAAAWSIPVVILATATPAAAAS
jgi:hypothetical protein